MRRLLSISLLLIPLSSAAAPMGLDQKEARKLISRIAGAQLPSESVRVKRITETSDGAEATADIETAFRLVQDKQGIWRVCEVRTGQDQWEDLSLLIASAHVQMTQGACSASDLPANRSASDLSIRRARCLIASALRIALPSDAVRIRSVSTLGLPLTSAPSALVVALVRIDFRFKKEGGSWRLSELRTDSNDWISIDAAKSVINEEKRKRAQAELATLARALEDFRRDSGFYIASDKEPVLVDHLSPHYLAQVIRLDPWHNPYQYQGERDRYLLRSYGPDGKENTGDDIVVTSQARPAS